MNATKTKAGKTARTRTEVVNAEVVGTEVKKAVESRKTIEMVEKIVGFNTEKASSYDRLMDAKRRAIVDGMSLSKLVNNFLESGVNLTDKQKECLTFKNIITFVKGSKYCDLKLFSAQQMVYICSGVIKLHDNNTARAIKADKQNAKTKAI
jgi:hypothetical protein